ncbi:MAG: 5-formyltetrahydrofolate cyclo-ligase [Gemmatimonadota bacterium]
MADKNTLRGEARGRLRSISPEERARFGDAIAERVWTLPEATGARAILLYASLPEEVPTRAIALEAHRHGVAVVYPRCLPEGREMTLHIVSTPDELTSVGRYGIMEPDEQCPTTDVGDIDLAFIPGLAWDSSGHRLGRGAGYYDRMLAAPGWQAFRCGLFFSVQEMPSIPVDPWDVSLDAVVTEVGVRRAKR